eukprot:TRINITY_DN1833_c0_g1_i6.p2 TRINITY_DN1833_c0_g1~~TRINITY_DN1833_c0_g1_i6.p2  ORF type:complete len:120 (+),score=4.59 TRINITY_DN1833_c0_g1_i6:1017-1376(+)
MHACLVLLLSIGACLSLRATCALLNFELVLNLAMLPDATQLVHDGCTLYNGGPVQNKLFKTKSAAPPARTTYMARQRWHQRGCIRALQTDECALAVAFSKYPGHYIMGCSGAVYSAVST